MSVNTSLISKILVNVFKLSLKMKWLEFVVVVNTINAENMISFVGVNTTPPMQDKNQVNTSSCHPNKNERMINLTTSS